MGKSTISMAIFNSFLYVYQRVMGKSSEHAGFFIALSTGGSTHTNMKKICLARSISPFSDPKEIQFDPKHWWLLPHVLLNISILGWWSSSDGMMTFPTEWENKSHVPNHQPDINYNQLHPHIFGDVFPNVIFFGEVFPKKHHARSRSLRQVAPHHPQRQATLRRPCFFAGGCFAKGPRAAVLRPWKYITPATSWLYTSIITQIS